MTTVYVIAGVSSSIHTGDLPFWRTSELLNTRVRLADRGYAASIALATRFADRVAASIPQLRLSA
jgi:hypothetical protein